MSHKNSIKLEFGAMPNVMAAQPNIGGAVCESTVTPFRVARRKFWLTPTARVPCSNAANVGESKFWTQSEVCKFAPGKIPSGGESPRKYINSAPVQETAKRRARFGWPPVSDVAAVTKPRCETR